VEDIHAPLTEPALHALLVQALARGGQPVRLLGVGVRLMPPAAPHSGRHSQQLELFA
jgi:DNA polymerase-4